MEEQRPGKQCVQSRRPEPAWRTAGISRLRPHVFAHSSAVAAPPPGPLNSAPPDTQRPRAARACPVRAQPPSWQCPGGGGATRCGEARRGTNGLAVGEDPAGAGARPGRGGKLPGRCSSAGRPWRRAAARRWTPAAGAARGVGRAAGPERGRLGGAGGGCGRVSRNQKVPRRRGRGWGRGRGRRPRAGLCPGAARLGLVPRVKRE